MHLLTSSLTAAALIAHALLGCCWHHAHAEQEVASTDGRQALKPVVHGNHVHWHEGESNESGESGHHHDGQQDCGEAECIFAGSAPRVQILSPLFGFDVPVIASAFSLAAGRLDAAYVARTAADGSPREAIHLLYQVLVI